MEVLVNSDWIIDIKRINRMTGGNRVYQIEFEASDGKSYQLAFDSVWDIRWMIKNACLERSRNFCRQQQFKSSILLVENSEYLKYFEHQISGSYPTDEVKDYFIFDKLNTIVEVLAIKDPILTEVI